MLRTNTDRQTDRQTNGLENPTHAGVGNEQRCSESFICYMIIFLFNNCHECIMLGIHVGPYIVRLVQCCAYADDDKDTEVQSGSGSLQWD